MGKKVSYLIFYSTTQKSISFFLSETFISSDYVFDSTIRGFDFEPKSQSNGDAGGGVGAYIKNGVQYTRRVDLEPDDLQITWLEIVNRLLLEYYAAPRIAQNIQTKIFLNH